MAINELICSGCGAPLKEVNGKAQCPYCGRELIINTDLSDQIQATISETVKNLKNDRSEAELNSLKHQLIILREEKGHLAAVWRKTHRQKKRLTAITAEEKVLISRIKLLSNPISNNAASKEHEDTWEIESDKSPSLTLLLTLFLGMFGIQRFYTRHTAIGIFYLLTVGGFGLGWLLDIILILSGNFKDSSGYRLAPISVTVRKWTIGLIVWFGVYVFWMNLFPESGYAAFFISVLLGFCAGNYTFIWGKIQNMLDRE